MRCNHLRSITGQVGAEFQGNDWVCPKCLEVALVAEKPPRMWPKVPMCRRCSGLRETVEQSFGVLLVKHFPSGTRFAS